MVIYSLNFIFKLIFLNVISFNGLSSFNLSVMNAIPFTA